MKVVSKVGYDTRPQKLDIHTSQRFVIVADEFGSVFFHDFREKLGSRRPIEDFGSPISCIFQNESEVVFFDEARKSWLMDFRTNEIRVVGRMPEIVRCAVPSKDPRFIFVGDIDVRLVNKESMAVNKVHRIDRGPILGMGRFGDDIFTGGFDTELKVT